MQTFTLLLCLAAATGTFASAIFERAGCRRNQCLRQIDGSRDSNPPRSVRLADCSSYQMYTVTPEPTTIYTTTTVATTTSTQTVIPFAYHNKRAGEAHPTPAYATKCNSPADYASACSCAGFTATTVTSGTTATITITATTTSATATPTPTGVSFACSPADSSSKCGGACNGICFPDVTGKGWCKQNKECEGLTACTANSDCSSRVCLVNGCGSVCADMTYFCPNPFNANILFSKPTHVRYDAKQEKI